MRTIRWQNATVGKIYKNYLIKYIQKYLKKNLFNFAKFNLITKKLNQKKHKITLNQCMNEFFFWFFICLTLYLYILFVYFACAKILI